MSGRSFNYGPREATDPRCCATCRFAVLRSGRGGALHHQCVVRGASLPTRERLRTVGCDKHQLNTESKTAMDIWDSLTDEHGWSETDFTRLT